MKNQINGILVVVLLALYSCGGTERANDGMVRISGKVENPPEGIITLSMFTETKPKVLDTLQVNEAGEFSYDLENADPNFFELNLYGGKVVRLALYKEDVEVNYDFSTAGDPEIKGSKDSQEMLKIAALMEDYQAKVNKLNEAYYEAMNANNTEAIKQIQLDALALEDNQGAEVKKTIESMGNSFASLAAVGLLNTKNDFQFIDELVARLDAAYPETKMIVQMKQQLDEMRALSIGQVAPEIEMENPQGELVKLSDMKGKYVMIDFWAAWCKPCREENPNVVRLYNKYKDKGFEVFGVSLDRTKEAWVKAIADDGLEWTQVSDLKYFNSAAAEIYQIEAIPATYLLDPEGRIIAKDLRGASLENKLAALFD